MHAQTLGDLLSDTAETRQGRLFFPPLTPHGQELAARPPHTEAVLTVITMSGLVLPNPSVPREHWSFTERMSVPALHLASWYATRAIYGLPRHVRKVLALDECHFLAMWPVGRALFQRVGRDTRKYNVCCLAASQDPSDTLNMDVANHVSASLRRPDRGRAGGRGRAAAARGARPTPATSTRSARCPSPVRTGRRRTTASSSSGTRTATWTASSPTCRTTRGCSRWSTPTPGSPARGTPIRPLWTTTPTSPTTG